MQNILIRKAKRADVITIVRMLADDSLGAKREKYMDPLPSQYYCAFDKINADKNNLLIVAEINQKIVGTLQLTFTQHLTYQGGKRALIEGVRINRSYRGKGIGKTLLAWVISKARDEGCHLLQLTTDKNRPESLEFYKKLGFIASHHGLKLYLK
jgi:GNAT superfamily N-acetyltransferase